MKKSPISPSNIIQFWFEEINASQRFKKDPKFDQLLRDRFLEIHQSIVQGEKEDWRDTSEGALAYIIVLDQFSRNMFRGDPKSFAYDTQALSVTLDGLAKNFNKNFSTMEKQFFYMPMMHSEDPQIHGKALPLFESLGGESAKFEMLHKKIIDRFGRYPHRNEVLGRNSTPEEIEFLKEENSSF